MDFHNFLLLGNPSFFYDFRPLAVFAAKQYNCLNMCRLDARNRSTNTRHTAEGTYLLQPKHDYATGNNCKLR